VSDKEKPRVSGAFQMRSINTKDDEMIKTIPPPTPLDPPRRRSAVRLRVQQASQLYIQ
jgi:hypothetical protein